MDKNFEAFYFESFDFDKENFKISLNYSLDKKIKFTETFEFEKKVDLSHINEDNLNLLLQNMLLAFGISYYKCFCPRKMKIEGFSISKKEAAFWTSFYKNGMGEFFYQNNINPEGIINFEYTNDKTPKTFEVNFDKRRFLVPIGGGKDSILTTHILLSMGFKKEDIFACVANLNPIAKNCIDMLGLDGIYPKRTLSPNVFELNKQGVLNGHIPVTGCYYFLLLFISYVYKFTDVVFALEHSASEPQAKIGDFEVNHQYSKSFQYEKDFNLYMKENISPSFNIYSILRPFNELKIVELFATNKELNCQKHFFSFSSCNKNFKFENKIKERWCQNCPKCAFVFLLFSPFLDDQTLEKIFGSNLFYNDELIETYDMLLGSMHRRPFECVGSLEESIAACYMTFKQERFLDSYVMQSFKEKIFDKNSKEYFEALVKKVLSFQDEHCINDKKMVDFLKSL